MGRTRGHRANMGFLFGSVFFFFLIVITIGLFVYFSLYNHWNKAGDARFAYEISFASSFEGKAYSLYMNDSLLYVGAPVDCDTVVRLNRFAQDNALLVVDGVTDRVSILEIPDRGRIMLRLSPTGVVADIKK